MENLANSQSVRNSIKDVLNFLAQTTGLPYIPVSGSSLLSTRTTNDIDLLIPLHTTENFLAAQKSTLEAIVRNQIEKKKKRLPKRNCRPISTLMRLNFFFSMDIEGIQGSPVGCDTRFKDSLFIIYVPMGIEGENKRASDLFDINWIS